MLILQGWFGRLGNNIIQIGNMIDIAILHKHNIRFKITHPLFDLQVIEDYFSKFNNKNIITDKCDFFYSRIQHGDNQEKIRLLKKSFRIKNVNKLPEDHLIIHLRSGDIFSQNPHPNYVPPPLSYYIKNIDKDKHKKIIILCEDNKNPILDKLLEIYENSSHQINNLEDDIRLLLGATSVIYSVGTFAHSVLSMSNNIKHIYGKTSDNEELNEYYLLNKPWKNTKLQREYMMSYQY